MHDGCFITYRLIVLSGAAGCLLLLSLYYQATTIIYLLVADFAITKNLFLGCCFVASSKATRTGWSTVEIMHQTSATGWLVTKKNKRLAKIDCQEY
jgi:hypothetical protein